MSYSKIYMRLSALVSLFLSVVLAVPPARLMAATDIGELLEDKASVKITMDLQDISLRDALKMLSVQSGTNFIASEAVADRKLTLYLDNVPLRDALDKIFKVNNLTYELDVESNIFTVSDWGKPSLELETRVYFLKYTRVTNSRVNEGISSGSSSSSSTSSSAASSPSGATGSSESSSSSSSTASGIKDTLETVLSEYGKLIEDPATNSLIITDMHSKFPVIEQLIAKLDVPIPQVMIEVEILDVDKADIDRLGFKFSGTNWLQYTGPNLGSVFPLTGDALAKGLHGGKVGVTSQPVWDMRGLTFAMDFLATRSSTKFLARPRLFVLNNETAELRLSANEAIGSLTTTLAGTTSSSSTSVERAETGVILNVTPQISLATNEITMTLQPTVREAVKSSIVVQGQQETKDVEERSVKSTIRVKDGETVIIGGLIRNKDLLTKTRVPLLGEIPVLGMLFRHKDTSGSKAREILVFITPKIIKGSAPSARGGSFAAPKRLGERKQDEFIGPSAGLAQEPKRNEIVSRALGMYESRSMAK